MKGDVIMSEKPEEWRDRPTVPLWPIAGKVLGIGRSTAYESAERGEIPVLTFGRRKVVPTAWLKKAVEAEWATNNLPKPAKSEAA
jgi:hypothetical protein